MVLDDKNVRRRFRASNYQVCSSRFPRLFSLYRNTYKKIQWCFFDSQQHEWSRSSARCRWGWMRGGIRSSLTCLTSHAGRTARTILRPCECRFTRIAESAVSTFLIASTRRRNFHRNLSCFCPSPSRTAATTWRLTPLKDNNIRPSSALPSEWWSSERSIRCCSI